MQLSIPLLDHAVASSAEALRHWKAEERKTDDKRDAFRISLALQQAHLAIEKLLKHAVAAVDEHLLLEQPTPRLLRDLRKEVQSQGLPSIFASRRYLASSNAEQAWTVVQDVLAPPIAPITASAFEAALKALTGLRNQSQHGVMHVDTGEALGSLERVFARIPEVAVALCPRFLELLEGRHPHQFAELKAIEAQVDAAWWTLRELLRKGRRISVPISVNVTRRPNLPTVQFSITRASEDKAYSWTPKAGESSLSLFAEIEPEQATGLFSRVITSEAANERQEARRQVVRRKLGFRVPVIPKAGPTEQRRPVLGGSLTNLGFPEPEGVAELRRAMEHSFARAYEQERDYIERYGLPPLEEGTVRLDGASAWITVPLSRRSTSHVTGDVVLRDCALSLSRRKPRGRLSALLLPRKSTQSENPIRIDGKVWLTSEWVVNDDSSADLPMGTIIRFLKGDVRLSVSPEAQVEAGAPAG